MKQNYLRRNFLKNSLKASGGLILFPTIVNAAYSGLTTENKLSHQTDIRKKLFGKQVEISGHIFDTTGENTLRGAQVEFWHLSPNSRKIGHKGNLVTDENGYYRLFTDYPDREFGKHTTIHFKVSEGKQSSITELKFSDFGAHISHTHWEANNKLHPDLLFPKLEKSLYKTKITFNISINQ